MEEIRKRARELMAGKCRVCPVCNGVACAGEVPGMGGIGTGASFKNNVAALARHRLNMRLIHSAAAPDLSTEVLGQKLSLPAMAAPIAGAKFNLGGGMSEEEYAEVVMAGCVEAGTMGMCGDGAPVEMLQAGCRAIKKVGGAGIPVLKPWTPEVFFERFKLVEEAGAKAIGMDIDAAGLITLAKMGKPVSPKPAAAHREIIQKTGLKVILKGVMTPEDALLAVEAGAAGIVVSNHGGRVLDHTPGTAEVLPAIADRVKGRIAILADGGVRCGADVLKMIALGADAVLLGRPLAIAAVGGGKAGVVKYLDQIRSQLLSAMILTGCPDVRSIDRRALYD